MIISIVCITLLTPFYLHCAQETKNSPRRCTTPEALESNCGYSRILALLQTPQAQIQEKKICHDTFCHTLTETLNTLHKKQAENAEKNIDSTDLQVSDI